jgi:hypothetical protein
MTDHTAGGESRARCDAPHTKAKGPHASEWTEPLRNFVASLRLMNPGEKVRMRVKPLAGSPLAPLLKHLAPAGGEYVILGVITERQKFGVTTRYRVGDGTGPTFELAPELVEAVPEPRAVSEAELREAIERCESQPLQTTPGPTGLSYVEFNQIAPGLMESECGRFRVTLMGDRWSAFDTWTGETSSASTERGPALDWIARRAGAAVPSLNWTDVADGARARHMGVTFEVFSVAGGRWKAFDPRFTAEAFRSPLFPTLNKAKEWCAVRAMCEAQPLRDSSGARPVLVTV